MDIDKIQSKLNVLYVEKRNLQTEYFNLQVEKNGTNDPHIPNNVTYNLNNLYLRMDQVDGEIETLELKEKKLIEDGQE